MESSGSAVKNRPAKARAARDLGSISGLGRSPGEGNDNPLQYSCLGNPKDRGAWQAKESESHSVMSDSLRPHGLYKPWNSPGQNTGEGSHSLLQGLFPTKESNPGLSQRISDSLPAKPQGKPKNIGVGSLSLLQQIFPTKESNWSLLHCRRILYQLSYQEISGYSPWSHKRVRHHSN